MIDFAFATDIDLVDYFFHLFQGDPDRSFTKFVLADGLIYVNAIEQLASNMEFALIGGYNAALLIARDQIHKSN